MITDRRCPSRISITILHVLAHVPSRSGTRGRLWFWAGAAQASSKHVMFPYVPLVPGQHSILMQHVATLSIRSVTFLDNLPIKPNKITKFYTFRYVPAQPSTHLSFYLAILYVPPRSEETVLLLCNFENKNA